MNEFITHKIEANVGFVVLNRPAAYNALMPGLLIELKGIMDEFIANKFVRCIVVSGNGNSFCAGADLKWMKASSISNDEINENDSRLLSNLFYTIHNSPKPVIAAVHGPVFGGGLGLMACCDIVVADESSRFKFSEVRLGLTPSTILPYVVYRMGYQLAKVKILTAELFNAKQALKYGLVDYLVKADVLHFALNVASDLIKGSPEAIAETKNLLAEIKSICDTEMIIEKTVASLSKMKKDKNAQEGLNAFIEKRDPEWS